MFSLDIVRVWIILYAFSGVTSAKREEIQLQDGQPYNLTVTNNHPDEGRPSSIWLVRAPDDCRILVRFVEFMLQNIDDTLIVGTGSGVRDSSSILARFSGSFPSQSILVPSQRAWLKLNSSAGSVLPHRLEIILEAIHNEREVSLPENQTIEISSPGYPHDYPNYADILWRFAAAADQSVTFRFRDIYLENRYDKIIIGTGSDFSDRGTHLTSISNQFNKTDLPTDLIVPGDREIWLRFQADISKTFRGFLIEVTSRPGNFEEFVEEPGEQQLEITSPVDIASKNYPFPYPRLQNTSWDLHPPINQLIRVDVISCHLEPKHDFVEIGTRLTDDSNVLVLTGSSTPRGFYVEFPVNESVSIRFQSDYSVAYQGFWLRVSSKVEREIQITPIMKMESPESQPDLGGSSNKDESNHFMIPLVSAIGIVVLLMLVSALTVSCYCVRRRRTTPMKASHDVLSHLYTTPDTGALHTPPHSHHRSPDSPSRSVNIPMVQVSCSNRVNEPQSPNSSAYHLYDNDPDYDAVGQATPTSIDQHVYSVAVGNRTRHDIADYSRVNHDYATSINDQENDYENYRETDMATTEVDMAVMSNKPVYMTKIENSRKAQVTNTYHKYLPMNACTARKPTEKNTQVLPVANTTENYSDEKKHEYANLTNKTPSDETTGDKTHGARNISDGVTMNNTHYEAMSPERNGNVNETVYELENESGDGTVGDTYIIGNQRKNPRNCVVKPKVAPKRKKNKNNATQKNSYTNATYDKYSIS